MQSTRPRDHATGPGSTRSAAIQAKAGPGKRTLTDGLPGGAIDSPIDGLTEGLNEGLNDGLAPGAASGARSPGEPAASAPGGQRPTIDRLFGAGPRTEGGGSGGVGLPPALQARMSRAFGTDFSQVRVHADSPEATAQGALAFTRGNDLHFAPGQWAPDTERGQELIGHELTHVVQQAQGRVATAQPKLGGGAAINADPGLEAEADALGSRAARGELVASGASPAPLAGPGPAIQRFKDPVSEVEVDIAQLDHDAVEKYLDLVQHKELKVSAAEFRQLSLRRKEHLVDRQKIGDLNRRGMNAANAGTGPRYLHNLSIEERAELTMQGVDPSLGYADPAYFHREAKFTWRVLPEVSAAAAIRAFLRPDTVTVAECQTVLQAVFYHTVLAAVGDAKFDAVLGAADRVVPEQSRLLLQMDFTGKNPLGKLLESVLDGAPVSLDPHHPHAMTGGPSDHVGLDREERGELTKDRDGELVSAPGHRPAKLGGWYYMKNHEYYTERHKGGLWAGENALYVGRNDQGQQIFSGFGLPNCTEAQMAATMAAETNRAPSVERAEALFQQGKYGLALPVLGDIGSVDAMTLRPSMIEIIDQLWGETHALDPRSETAETAKIRLKALLGDMELPGPITAEQILSQLRISEAAQPIGAEVQNAQNKQLRLRQITLAWANDEHPSGAACVVMTATTAKAIGVRVSTSDLIKYYAEQYGLEYLALEMQAAFKMLNQDVPVNVDLAKDVPQQYYFPLPSVFVKRVATASGFQMLGGKNLSPDQIKKVFDVDTLFDEQL